MWESRDDAYILRYILFVSRPMIFCAAREIDHEADGFARACESALRSSVESGLFALWIAEATRGINPVPGRRLFAEFPRY